MAWGGSQEVAETAAPLAPRYGAWISSRKRAASHPLSRSNPGSDHNEANTTAYALDFATYNGAPLAHAIAKHYGIEGYRTGTYTYYYIHVGGALFRIQILWAVKGHYDHVHLGVRLVSGVFNGDLGDLGDSKTVIVRPGSSPNGPTKRLKRKLNRAGFRLKVNGSYGRKAQRAVKKFQRERGLKADAVVGPKTWEELEAGSINPTLRKGTKKRKKVKALKRLLRRNGFKVTINGRYSALTRRKVRKFQRKHGLKVDGIVGPKTWRALRRNG